MSLRTEVSKALVAGGYRREGRMHHLHLQPGCSFWVDTGPLGMRFDIAPFVGLRHDSIERLIGQLMGLPFDAWVGTVGANVGYVLGGEYRHWQAPTTVETVLEAIVSALTRLRSMAGLQDLTRLWDLIGRDDPWWRYREIVALFLMGEYARIGPRLEEARGDFCRQDDLVCEQFRGFSDRLRVLLPADELTD